jgi:arylsulfatase
MACGHQGQGWYSQPVYPRHRHCADDSLTKIKAPNVVDGIKQKPIEGTSFMYTFDAKNVNAPSRHTTQYFEMMGDHAIYRDGWIASTKVMRPPWVVASAVSQDPASFPYELYDLTKDWTQFDNVAAKYPDKVKEMDKLFWTEAAKYQVEPLDATVATRIVAPRPNLSAGRTEFIWSGEITGTPNGDAPSILDSSFNFKAEVNIPQDGAEGMIVTQGGRFGGYGFYVLKGKAVFLYNFVDLQRTGWEAPDVLSPGKHTLEFDFKYDGLGFGTLAFNNVSGIGRGGTGVLKVDGKEVANKTIDHTMPLIMQWDENFDIGADTGTPVSDDYQVPFKFTGTLEKLTLTIDRPKLSPADVEKLKAATRNNRAAE